VFVFYLFCLVFVFFSFFCFALFPPFLFFCVFGTLMLPSSVHVMAGDAIRLHRPHPRS